MSREIKFRAFVPKEKRIYSVKAICFDGRPTVTVRYNPVIKYPLDNVVMMQFTGLYDKNGKEIWEGDRVRRAVQIGQERHGEWADYEFVYRNGEWIASFLCSEKGSLSGYLAGPQTLFSERNEDAYFADDRNFQIIDVEVVGNIYENSEIIAGGLK